MTPEKIRNVILVGHGGSGKTTLAEALLYVAGVTNRPGRVEDGNTVTDFEPEETARQISLSLAAAPFEWNDHKINLLDAPGYADFVGEVRAGLRAADLALFVVSGVDGVEVQTELIWELADEEGVARAVFVSKLDRERASYGRVLKQLREVFGTSIAPLQFPVGAEAGLQGVVDVIANRAYLRQEGSRRGVPGDVPEGLAERVSATRLELVEAIVETDDELLERYLEGEEPSAEELVKVMRQGVADGSTVPVLCGSAAALMGIDLLAEFLVDFGPGPAQRQAPPLREGEGLVADPPGPVVAYVFKTMADPYVGRISLFRVFSGTVRIDEELENPTRGVQGRMHNVFGVRGKDTFDIDQVVAGDIAAVAKLEATLSGDTLRTPGCGLIVEPVAMPRPVMSVAVSPRTTADEEKLSTALERLADEDPALVVERRTDTNETVLSGLGDTHLDVAVARLARKFGVEVETATPKVPYRETITAAAQAEGKHKKQTGGRGQFGIAHVRFEPLPRGAGYEFVDEIKGGSIPRQYVPAVDKGIQEAFERGILAGYRVVDVRATVFDGKYHPVDSDELSFKMAGIMAVRAAAPDLRAVLLEPIARVTIRVPEDHVGDVMGDINAKRGRVLGMDSSGNLRIIHAQVPLAEMLRYAIDLRSLTGGRGTFEMEFDHYAEVPPHEAQKVIAAAQQEEG